MLHLENLRSAICRRLSIKRVVIIQLLFFIIISTTLVLKHSTKPQNLLEPERDEKTSHMNFSGYPVLLSDTNLRKEKELLKTARFPENRHAYAILFFYREQGNRRWVSNFS